MTAIVMPLVEYVAPGYIDGNTVWKWGKFLLVPVVLRKFSEGMKWIKQEQEKEQKKKVQEFQQKLQEEEQKIQAEQQKVQEGQKVAAQAAKEKFEFLTAPETVLAFEKMDTDTMQNLTELAVADSGSLKLRAQYLTAAVGSVARLASHVALFVLSLVRVFTESGRRSLSINFSRAGLDLSGMAIGLLGTVAPAYAASMTARICKRFVEKISDHKKLDLSSKIPSVLSFRQAQLVHMHCLIAKERMDLSTITQKFAAPST